MAEREKVMMVNDGGSGGYVLEDGDEDDWQRRECLGKVDWSYNE